MTIMNGLSGPDERNPTADIRSPKDIELLEVWQALWCGRRAIGLVMIVGLLLGVGFFFGIVQPRFVATATMVLQQQHDLASDLAVGGQAAPAIDLSQLNTELHVLQSHGLIQKLVDRLGLSKDAEFNPAPTANELGDLKQVVETVQAAISVREQRNSRIVTVSATSRMPEKAVLMANSLTGIYLEEQIASKFASAQKTETWLSERVGTLRQTLSEQEGKISRLQSGADITASEDLSVMTALLQDAKLRLSGITERLSERSRDLQTLRALRASGELGEIAKITGSRALRKLLVSVDNKAREIAIDTQLNAIETELQQQLHRLEQQARILSQSITDLKAKTDVQRSNLGELQQLEREAYATRVLYETLLARLREASTLQGLQRPNARVLSPAVIAQDQSVPLPIVLLFATLLGAFLASMYVLVRKFVYAGFRTAEELERATGKPVLGQLPAFQVKDREQLLPFLTNHPTSAASEAVRNLRTSVLMSHPDRPPQVILSASSIPGEGKTTHAIALAQNFAAMGKRVLLIDGDMRRRTLCNYFPAEIGAGLVAALTGDADLASAARHIPSLGADVLLGEDITVSAADMFASHRFANLIVEARSIYDIVIIDSPPVLVVPDARVISHHADAIIFSVAWDKTTRRQVAAALKQFDLVGSPVTGTILSQIKPKRMERYGDTGTNAAYAGFGQTYYDTV